MSLRTQSLVPPARAASAPGRLVRLLDRLLHAFRIGRERRLLAGLDDAALKDIGLSRADVARECRRALWDLPLDRF